MNPFTCPTCPTIEQLMMSDLVGELRPLCHLHSADAVAEREADQQRETAIAHAVAADQIRDKYAAGSAPPPPQPALNTPELITNLIRKFGATSADVDTPLPPAA
jgi:hypothetical protein